MAQGRKDYLVKGVTAGSTVGKACAPKPSTEKAIYSRIVGQACQDHQLLLILALTEQAHNYRY